MLYLLPPQKEYSSSLAMTKKELLELVDKAISGSFDVYGISSGEQRTNMLRAIRLLFMVIDFIEPSWSCGCDRCEGDRDIIRKMVEDTGAIGH